MHQYVTALDDEEIARGIEPLPGFIYILEQLSDINYEGSYQCVD